LDLAKLEAVCGKYGTVIRCVQKKVTDNQGNTRTLAQATVTYASKEEATTAMQKLYMDNEINPSAQLQVDFF
jgi:hypothetical protein